MNELLYCHTEFLSKKAKKKLKLIPKLQNPDAGLDIYFFASDKNLFNPKNLKY